MFSKYFTKEEIESEKNKFFLKTYTLSQNIFSIRNSLEKAYKVICYEIDTDMVYILQNRFESYINEGKLVINQKDFLKANLE